MSIVHTELSESIDRLVANPVIARLYREWQDLAVGDDLPAFAAFDPEARPTLAGHLMVMEPGDGAFRYAHYGFRIAAAAGFDMTGRLTSDFRSEVGAFFERKYREVIESGRPLYTVHHAEHVAAVVSWERLIMPVRSRAGDRVIVCYNVPLDRKAEILDGLMDASMDGIVVLQPVRGGDGGVDDFRYLIVNRRAGSILNREPDSLVGNLVSTVYPQATGRLPVYREVMATGEPRQFELSAQLEGETRTFRLSTVRAGDKLVVTLSDITEMRRMMDQLERQQTDLLFANETLQEQAENLVSLVEDIEEARGQAQAAQRFVADLMEAVPVPLFYWNLDGTLNRANRHYAAVYGQTTETIVGKRPEDILPPHVAKFLREHNARLLSGSETNQMYEGDVETAGRGRRRFVVHRALMRDPADRPTGIAGAMLDLTDEYALRRELERLASTDPLTGLYNRRVFMERLEQALALFRRYGQPAAVALLDVDHFKSVNDTYGHDFGDKVLVDLARLLRGQVRDDVDVVARFGGEEFVVLMPETDEHGGCLLAERLRQAFADLAFETPAGPRNFTASFGVAAVIADDDVTSLLRRTDEALYRSKDAGRNRVTRAGSPPPGPATAIC
ncbi:MAG: diguanylate cyclase [Thalassobaculum sp.]|uniref:diguanylate cyclase n=1 Tax=Thalassobaculum sp. TaxID=2022740 RepID=UPI0032EFE689